MTKKARNKKKARKETYHTVWSGNGKVEPWCVKAGKLVGGRGRPAGAKPIFLVVAEKIPYGALSKVQADMLQYSFPTEGVYLAHDSMGVARYGGRGQVFVRLAAHKRKHPTELSYFSFYIISDKKHEREIETVILRAAGPQLTLNERKVALGTKPGDVRDYEPGTEFFERQSRKEKRKGSKRKRSR